MPGSHSCETIDSFYLQLVGFGVCCLQTKVLVAHNLFLFSIILLLKNTEISLSKTLGILAKVKRLKHSRTLCPLLCLYQLRNSSEIVVSERIQELTSLSP